MSSLLTHGLSSLMEACNYSQRAEAENDSLVEAMEETIDDDIIRAVTGANEDSVEADMAGDGIGDEDEISRLVDQIPESDETMDEEIGSLTESMIPEELL